jgi:hypothetical protein
MAELTDEEVCDFYYALSKRLPPHLFACVPHPLLVETNERLAAIYNEHLKGSVRTNEFQVEYHRRMQEEPEKVAEHVAWYNSKLGLDTIAELPELIV